jgi:hypothetical protein
MFPNIQPQHRQKKVLLPSIGLSLGARPTHGPQPAVNVETGVGVCGLPCSKVERTTGVEGCEDTEIAHWTGDHPYPAGAVDCEGRLKEEVTQGHEGAKVFVDFDLEGSRYFGFCDTSGLRVLQLVPPHKNR